MRSRERGTKFHRTKTVQQFQKALGARWPHVAELVARLPEPHRTGRCRTSANRVADIGKIDAAALHHGMRDVSGHANRSFGGLSRMLDACRGLGVSRFGRCSPRVSMPRSGSRPCSTLVWRQWQTRLGESPGDVVDRIPGLRGDLPAARVLQQHKGPHITGYLGVVLDHLAPSQRNRDAADDPDVAAHAGLGKRLQRPFPPATAEGGR